MPKSEEVIFGAPCWVDMTSENLETVKPFYTALFGWEYEDSGEELGNYNIISVGEDVVGGAMQYHPDFMGPNPFSVWSVYFATENAEASLNKTVENGGSISVPAMEVPTQGTMGEGKDSTGSSFGVWQPDTRKGFDRWGEHGFPGWFELHTRDFDAASKFYSTLLGAELGGAEMSEGMRYHTLDFNGQPSAGIWDINGVLPDDAPTNWNVYFIVDDTDAAVVTAKEHGGTVLSEPEDTPHGRMSTLQDPAGAVFYVISGGEM